MNPQFLPDEIQTSEIKNTAEYTESNAALRETQERALRVTEALYRTTDLFSDNEPLKWSLRESAVKILQTVSALDQHASFEDLREVQRVGKNIRELLVKIELAASGAFMVRKNFEVLQREYLTLRDFVATMTTDSRLLSSAPTKIADMLVFNLGGKEQIEEKDIGKISITEPEQKESQKTPLSKIAGEMSERTGQMSERKGRILRFIQERGSSGIGDIARSLEAGISEKTVQRDLNALVESGLLKKEGEKRWRRYFV